jgi:hypothetical protein
MLATLQVCLRFARQCFLESGLFFLQLTAQSIAKILPSLRTTLFGSLPARVSIYHGVSPAE